MTWSSWSCCYPYIGKSDTSEFIEKTVFRLLEQICKVVLDNFPKIISFTVLFNYFSILQEFWGDEDDSDTEDESKSQSYFKSMSDICISAPLLLKSFSKLTIEFSCSDIMPCAHHVHSSGYLMMRAANRQTEAKVDPRRYIVKVNIIRLRMSFVCPVPLSMPN